MADTCASLSAELAALRAEVAKIQSLTKQQVRSISQATIDANKSGIITATKSAIEPGLLSAIAGAIAVAFDKLTPKIDKNTEDISNALKQVHTLSSETKSYQQTEQERLNGKILEEKRATERAINEAKEITKEANRQLAEAEERARQGIATEFDRKNNRTKKQLR
ncbi:hypothetical protein [Nostoc sp.]|uniref:hypothetical protein n=1 Tax=Nostoc sp. TaxID=1180 RepID=UPI002FFD0BE3